MERHKPIEREIELLPIGAVAAALGLDRRQVLTLLKTGKLHAIQFRGKRRRKVARSEIERNYLHRQASDAEVATWIALAQADNRASNIRQGLIKEAAAA